MVYVGMFLPPSGLAESKRKGVPTGQDRARETPKITGARKSEPDDVCDAGLSIHFPRHDPAHNGKNVEAMDGYR